MYGLQWTLPDNVEYEVGVDQGVFYASDGVGYAWNGLVSVKEVTDSDLSVRYIDGVRIANRQNSGEFTATIEAFTYPAEFDQQTGPFGFSYRVMSDTEYKIHVVYNALASPSPQSFAQSEAATFTWDISALPISIPGGKFTAHLIIDAKKAYPWTISAFEDVLYGTDIQSPRLPLPSEIFDIFEVNSMLRVTDHGDGTCTIEGPDEAILMLDATTVEIDWPSVVIVDANSCTISSL